MNKKKKSPKKNFIDDDDLMFVRKIVKILKPFKRIVMILGFVWVGVYIILIIDYWKIGLTLVNNRKNL